MKSLPSRKVEGMATPQSFFYNPMWRPYGQQPIHEAGAATHYWTKKWTHELAWHMLDQVIIRPGESVRFPENQLRIVTEVGAIPLLNANGIPDAAVSDHLPVIFRWNL
jgi:hypothetical protein